MPYEVDNKETCHWTFIRNDSIMSFRVTVAFLNVLNMSLCQ